MPVATARNRSDQGAADLGKDALSWPPPRTPTRLKWTRRPTRTQIKAAIEKLYNVKVVDVRTVNVAGQAAADAVRRKDDRRMEESHRASCTRTTRLICSKDARELRTRSGLRTDHAD